MFKIRISNIKIQTSNHYAVLLNFIWDLITSSPNVRVNRLICLLVSQDKFSLTLAYTIENKWHFGIESSFVGNQYLYENQRVKDYAFWAGSVERKFGTHLSLVLNAENILNVKQLDYEKVVTGFLEKLSFNPIWVPHKGAIVNLALKYKL